jgi:hypothetical protein
LRKNHLKRESGVFLAFTSAIDLFLVRSLDEPSVHQHFPLR